MPSLVFAAMVSKQEQSGFIRRLLFQKVVRVNAKTAELDA